MGSIEGVLSLLLAFSLLAYGALLFHGSPALAIPATLVAGLGGYWITWPLMSLGPVAIYLGDATAAALFLALILGVASGRARLSRVPWWWLLTGLAFIALVRGAAVFGVEQAGLAIRAWIWFLAPVLFFGTRSVSTRFVDVFYRSWRAALVVLAFTALVFLVRNGFGTYAQDGSRALTSGQALVISQAAILSFLRQRKLGPLNKEWAMIIIGLIVLLVVQQRTVWLVTVSCVFLIAFSGMNLGARAKRRVRALVVTALIAIVGLTAAAPASLVGSLTKATAEPASRDSTLKWRVEGWAVTIEQRTAAPALDKLIGERAGDTGFVRGTGSGAAEVSPHNLYVATVVSLGVIGLLALLAAYVGLVRKLRAKALTQSDQAALGLRVLLLGQLVYFLAYQTSLEQGVLVGVAYAVAFRSPAPGEAVDDQKALKLAANG